MCYLLACANLTHVLSSLLLFYMVFQPVTGLCEITPVKVGQTWRLSRLCSLTVFPAHFRFIHCVFTRSPPRCQTAWRATAALQGERSHAHLARALVVGCEEQQMAPPSRAHWRTCALARRRRAANTCETEPASRFKVVTERCGCFLAVGRQARAALPDRV